MLQKWTNSEQYCNKYTAAKGERKFQTILVRLLLHTSQHLCRIGDAYATMQVHTAQEPGLCKIASGHHLGAIKLFSYPIVIQIDKRISRQLGEATHVIM